MTHKSLSQVISVCEKKDIRAWSIASQRIIRYIKSDSYVLICPENQVEEFKRVSAGDWEIVGEDRYSTGSGPEHIRNLVSGENINRVNWLFQQFLKINAIRHGPLHDEDFVLIWDSDTIPLKKIDFFEEGVGHAFCYHGREDHRPYFETIEKLFGFGKMSQVSFIAQCMPLKVAWVREMTSQIEGKFCQSYIDAILGVLPGRSGSEFSEYETIGSWVMSNKSGELAFKERNHWLRSGGGLLGLRPSKPRVSIVLWFLSFRFDYVAMENWRRPLTLSRLRYALRRFVENRKGR